MKIYRFRVLIDTGEEDVFRDIDIKANQTFEELHNAIQIAFEFDNSQLASFYMSDEDWVKGDEVTLFDMNEEGNNNEIMVMRNTKLSDLVKDEGQKLLYVFDFISVWTFFVDLVLILPKADDANYPVVVHFGGKAPEQYSKDGASTAVEDDLISSITEVDGYVGDEPYIDESFDDFDEHGAY